MCERTDRQKKRRRREGEEEEEDCCECGERFRNDPIMIVSIPSHSVSQSDEARVAPRV